MKPGPPAGPTVGLPALGPDVHRFSHEAMATVFEVICAHPDASYARQAADEAFVLVDRLEQDLSRFIGNSDVSRVNGLAAGRQTQVSPSTMECLVVARHLLDVTDGAFDVSLGTGLRGLQLDEETFVVGAAEDGVRVDLGGLGKGWAVDRAVELLAEWGIERALVHGGMSSVAAVEPPPGRAGWPLTLSAPGGGEVLARVEARQLALSASGTRKGAHILDPRSGRPVPEGAAWVLLPRAPGGRGSPATVAEGLSTAFMVLGLSAIDALCRETPGLEAFILRRPDGMLRCPGLVPAG